MKGVKGTITSKKWAHQWLLTIQTSLLEVTVLSKTRPVAGGEFKNNKDWLSVSLAG